MTRPGIAHFSPGEAKQLITGRDLSPRSVDHGMVLIGRRKEC